MFDHVKVSDFTIVCAGLGGVLYLLDTRQLNMVQQSIIDPSLHAVHELSASAHGDLLAIGRSSFTLWKSEGKASLTFRAVETEGKRCATSSGSMMRGAIISPGLAVTTDTRGDFQEWVIKKGASPDKHRRPSAASPRAWAKPASARPSPETPRAMHAPTQRRELVANKMLPPASPASGRRKTPYGSPSSATRGPQAAQFAMPPTPSPPPADSEGARVVDTSLATSAVGTAASTESSWDWDLDWKEELQHAEKGATPRARSELPSPRTPATCEEMHALNSKDLDELIGFYLG